MDTEIDLTTTTRDVLIAIIAQLQATVLEQQRVIERLQRRIAEQAKPNRVAHPECPASTIRAASHRHSSSPESSDATASPARV